MGLYQVVEQCALKPSNKDDENFEKLCNSLEVIKIENCEPEEVFDISVDDIHKFIIITDQNNEKFSGILVHNCEIFQPHTPLDGSEGESEIGVCILAGLNLGYAKIEDISEICEVLVNFLDNLTDKQGRPLLDVNLQDTTQKFMYFYIRI